MSSTRLVSVTGSTEVFVTFTAKEKLPPGSGRLVGVAVLVTVMAGLTSVRTTCARANWTTWFFSLSETAAATVST